MLGFLIGTACLIGLVKVTRGRCGAGYGYGHGARGWGGHGRCGWGGGYGFGRMGARGPLRYVFSRLETTPGQEKVIAQEVESLIETARGLRGEAFDLRRTVAAAIRGPAFNAEAFAEQTAKQDAALQKLQEALRTSLSKIHEALDDRQRQELANLIEGFGGFGHGRGGG